MRANRQLLPLAFVTFLHPQLARVQTVLIGSVISPLRVTKLMAPLRVSVVISPLGVNTMRRVVTVTTPSVTKPVGDISIDVLMTICVCKY